MSCSKDDYLRFHSRSGFYVLLLVGHVDVIDSYVVCTSINSSSWPWSAWLLPSNTRSIVKHCKLPSSALLRYKSVSFFSSTLIIHEIYYPHIAIKNKETLWDCIISEDWKDVCIPCSFKIYSSTALILSLTNIFIRLPFVAPIHSP